MLFWICPECGHECSPAIRECPTCTGPESPAPQPVAAQQETEISRGILALVESFHEAPAMPLLSAGAGQKTVAALNGHSYGTQETSTATLMEDAPSEPTREILPILQHLNAPPPERLEEVEAQPAAPEVLDSEPSQQEPAYASLQTVKVQCALEVQPSIQLAARSLPEPIQATEVQSVLEIVPSVPAGQSVALAQALEEEAKAVLQAIAAQPLAIDAAEGLAQALECQAESLLDTIAEQLEKEQSGIRAILAALEEQPAVSLLGAPREIVTAPAPPIEERIRTPRPAIAMAEPKQPDLAAVVVGPQMPTLAGPSLPAQLKSTEKRLSGREGFHRPSRFPSWPVSFLVAILVLLGAGSLAQYLKANRDVKATPISGPPAAQSVPGNSSEGALEEHPSARFVEVAGVRLTNGPNHRPQVQYIVINHSARDLTGLAVRLALRSADEAASAAPLVTVFSKIPTLGAYQSREIRTELDTELRSSSVPDWQTLRPEVLVSRLQRAP